MTDSAAPRQRVHTFRDDALGADDATALAARLRSGEVSPTELVEAAIARCEEVQPVLGALAHTDYDRARTRAGRAAPSDPGAPLAGVPTAFKDNLMVEGTPMTQGSPAVPPVPGVKDGAVARRFLGTGLIPVGTTAMPPFGWSAVTERQGGVATRNPWDVRRSPGGSSGGAGALVAAGALPVAHGNDGGGSIRIPAAACGLVGFKPSRGRLPADDWARGMPLNLVGQSVLTRSVRDVVTVFGALESGGRTAPDRPIGAAATAPSRRLRVGLLEHSPVGPPTDAPTLAVLRSTAALLESLGHHVEPADAPVDHRFEDDFVAYFSVLSLGMTLSGRRRFGRDFRRADLDPFTAGLARRAVRRALRLPVHGARLARTAAAYDSTFGDLDIVLSPVVSHVTPDIGYLDADLPFETHLERVSAWVTFTPLHNVAGAPAISLPTGADDDGLPVGVQISARRGADPLLLEVAAEIEAARPWRDIRRS